MLNNYLETVFSTKYFSEEALVSQNSKIFNFIRKIADAEFSYSDFSVIGQGNRIVIKQSDIIKCSLEQDTEISINQELFLIKTIKRNNDGTAEVVLESK